MTSNNKPTPRPQLGPWGAVGAIAVLAVILLGFIAGVVAVLNWGGVVS